MYLVYLTILATIWKLLKMKTMKTIKNNIPQNITQKPSLFLVGVFRVANEEKYLIKNYVDPISLFQNRLPINFLSLLR